MNNNPQNNNGDIDDILEILKKRKEENLKSNPSSGEMPTRVDNDAVKKVSDSSAPKAASSRQREVQKPSENKTVRPSQPQQKKSTGTTGVSLSDFDNIKSGAPKQKTKKKFRMPGYAKVAIYLIIILAVSILISLSVINVANDTFAFVKPDEEIVVNIEDGATLKDVADVLHENNVIKYPFVYRVYAKMRMDKKSYYSGNFVAGEHTLNSNLGYDKLIAKLAESKYTREVVRVTIPEGLTVYEIIDLFVEKRVIAKDAVDAFKDRLNTAAFEYDFLSEFNEIKDENGKVETDRIYLLEGYLFPDTYDFYVNEDHDTVISKLLGNFDRKFEETYYERCQSLGITVDEAITLASMIEAEGNRAEDFYKISSVFHNRLKSSAFPFLNSDATTLYSFQGEKKQLDAGDNKSRVHPYNTYLNKGLPPGPICNPGTEAIHAALYPESTGYYYFYTATSNGVTYYSSNESQHNTYIQKDRNGTLK